MAFYGGRKLIMNFLIGSFNNIVSHLAYRQLDNRSLSYKLNDDTAAWNGSFFMEETLVVEGICNC
jgi:hypothetical protein